MNEMPLPIAPMPLAPMAWQQSHWLNFCTRLAEDRLPHALLLVAAEGMGADALARAMGQLLLCLSPLQVPAASVSGTADIGSSAQSPPYIACGTCRSCTLLAADSHPDFVCVTPEAKGKPIKIDQVRTITQRLDQTAQQSSHKVILLMPAEAMNINAANALLKNLEEPAGRAVFILVANQLSAVIPTVRSRCTKMVLPRPSDEQACAWLLAQGLDQPQALLFEAQGAPLLAKALHDEGQFARRVAIIGDLAKLHQGQFGAMAFAKKWKAEAVGNVLAVMMNVLDVTLFWQLAGRDCPPHYQHLAACLEACPPVYLFRLRERLCGKKLQLWQSPNLNAALLIEELALDWAALVRFAQSRTRSL